MSSLKVFFSSPVYVTIDPSTSSVVASPFCLVELWLAIFWAMFTRFSSSLVVASEMPLREFVVQFKTRKNLWLTIKLLLFVLNSSKGDNGFENILK